MTSQPDEQRTLVLLRHARAEQFAELGDHARPLAAAGRAQAATIGSRLEQEVGGFDVALVSDAKRTRETYRLLAARGHWPEAQPSRELYGAGPQDVLALLTGLESEVRRVLVVGHEPTMSALTHLLGAGSTDLAGTIAYGMGTASAAVLQVPLPWPELDASTARLLAVLRPE